MRVDELDSKLPVILPHLTHDAYFTINGFYDSPRSWLSPVGLRYVTKTKLNLRTLNAAYCDLDCGRPHSPKPEQRISAQEALHRAVGLLELPPVSAFAFSGRGLYLFWRLHDHGKPLSSLHNVERYGAINDALFKRMRHLAADPMAKDASRILRVPNSIHTKSGNRVSYQLFRDPAYSLVELEVWLGLRRTQHYTLRKTAKERPKIAKMKGIITMNCYRAEDILKIERHAGGWGEGERKSKITKYAQCLRNATFRESETVTHCQQMAARCRPPFPEVEVERLVAGVYKGHCYRFRSQTLCEAFGITGALAQQLGLTSIVPDQERENRKVEKRATREQGRSKQQSLITGYIATHPSATAREIQALCEENGIKISPRHINRLLKQAGVRSAQRGRPRKGRVLQTATGSWQIEAEFIVAGNFSIYGGYHVPRPYGFDEQLLSEVN